MTVILRKSVNILKIEASMKANDIEKAFLLKRQHIIIFADFALFAAKTKEMLKKKVEKLKIKLLTVE